MCLRVIQLAGFLVTVEARFSLQMFQMADCNPTFGYMIQSFTTRGSCVGIVCAVDLRPRCWCVGDISRFFSHASPVVTFDSNNIRSGRGICPVLIAPVSDPAALETSVLVERVGEEARQCQRVVMLTSSDDGLSHLFMNHARHTRLLIAVASSSCTNSDDNPIFWMYSGQNGRPVGYWSPDIGLQMDEDGEWRGRIVKVGSFPTPPWVVRDDVDDIGYSTVNGGLFGNYRWKGRDVTLVREVSASLGAEVDLVEPPDGLRWGRHLANGTWTGIFGMVNRSEVDMACANLFLTLLHGHVMSPSNSYAKDYYCWAVPIPKEYAAWEQLLRPFTPHLWGLMAMAMVVTAVVLSRVTSLSHATHLLVTSLLQQSWSNPRRLRWLLTSWSFFAMLMMTAYRSSLVSLLATGGHPPPIQTLKELSMSGLQLQGDWFARMLHHVPSEPDLTRIYDKMVDAEDGPLALQAVSARKAAFSGSLSSLLNHQQEVYRDSGKSLVFHIARQCVAEFNVVLYTPHGSCLLPRVNQKIGRSLAAGLVLKWHEDSLEDRAVIRRRKMRAPGRNPGGTGDKAAFNLNTLSGAFQLLLFGYFISLTVLLLECGRKRFQLHRQPELPIELTFRR